MARYRELQADPAAPPPALAKGLRSLLRLIGDPCDHRYRRFATFLREAHGESLEAQACHAIGR